MIPFERYNIVTSNVCLSSYPALAAGVLFSLASFAVPTGAFHRLIAHTSRQCLVHLHGLG